MSLSARRKKIRIIARQTKSFTLVEVLLSVGILVILVSMVVVGLGAYKGRTAFDLDANQIVAVLRNAQARAVSQDRGQGWGVQFTNSSTTGSQYALFWGTSYTTSSVVVAGTLGYSSVFTDPAPGFSKTIVFNPVTGASAGPDVVVIKNTTSNNVAIITVSALGLVGETTESGLAGYWPMDEGGGTSTYDASGNNNNGTMTIGAGGTQTTISQAWSAGSPGKAGWGINFDGTDDYINAQIGLYFGQNNPLTASAWVYVTASSNGPVFGVTNSPPNTGWNMPFLSINGTTVYGWIWSVNSNVPLSSTVSANAWHLLTITYTPSGGGQEIFYVDGNAVASGAGQYAPSGSTDYFSTYIAGAKPTSVLSLLNTKIDDVRIYNRVLSATEIKNLFSAY